MSKQRKFNEFMEKVIKELKDEGRYGTAHVYQNALKKFSEFLGCNIISFSQINRATLKQFENSLRKEQLGWNTVSTYMRALRATYHKAANRGWVTEVLHLFENVYTGVKSDTKRALEVKDANKLMMDIPLKELPENLRFCRAWVNLMFQLCGMPFVDLANLHKSDLKGNILSYHRQKTGTEITVEVSDTAMELIRTYRSTNPDSPYLFTILSGEKQGEDLYMEYQQALREMNYNMGRLAVKCGVIAKVSTYTLRHTWATLAKYCHFSEQLISEAFGHSSTKMTETYMKSFKNEEIRKANETIIQYIKKNGKECA